MKYSILILALCCFIYSCRSTSNTNNSFLVKSDSSVSENTETIDTIRDISAEKNMRSQLEEYLFSIDNEDSDRAFSFIYPDAVVYMQNEFPDYDFTSQQIKDSIFAGPIKQMKSLFKKKGIKYSFQIGETLKKVDVGNKMLSLIVVYIHAERGLDKHTLGSETVAVSTDYGRNWKFIQNDDEIIRPILQMKLPSAMIDKLLDKN